MLGGWILKTVNLLYCGNDESYEEILLSLLSVMRHTKRRLCVYLIAVCDKGEGAPPMRASKIAYLSALLEGRKDGSLLVFKDVSDAFYTAFPDLSVKRLSCCAPLLLFLADKEELPLKILYLSASTVASLDVGLLFDRPIQKSSVLGVRKSIFDFQNTFGCFEDGVLLIDTLLAREEGLFEMAGARIKEGKKPFSSYGTRFRREYLSSYLCARSFKRKKSVVRHFPATLVLFPYPHFEKRKIFERNSLRKRERSRFAREIDQFYFCRDAYMEYEKNEEETFPKNLTDG
jgi:hypothetical protein